MVTKYVPRLSMAKFPRRRVCEIARCKNMEVNSLTRTGASAAFSHLICDDCLKDIVLLSIEKFRHDKDFKLAVSDIFGGETFDPRERQKPRRQGQRSAVNPAPTRINGYGTGDSVASGRYSNGVGRIG